MVIPVLTQNYTMLRRNLLYTGITRGKRLVVLVGQKKAVGHRGAQRLRTANHCKICSVGKVETCHERIAAGCEFSTPA